MTNILPSIILLNTIALGLIIIHFSVPLAYYYYLKKKWLPKPWDIKVNPEYKPKVTIIVPTYMGAKYIVPRLDNIYEQDYPKDKIEVIVVDSASPDGTADKVREWIKKHPDANIKLIVEPERHGKLTAVLKGLKQVSNNSDIIVLTDDDCLWDHSALKNIVKYFADPTIGAVTGSIKYLNNNSSDNAYRNLYNQVRIAESKWWSTPIHNGPLLALRKIIIDKIGLPTFPGADDSAFASYIAFAGYRAIQVDNAWIYEPITENQHKRMIRRATHLTIYFTKLKRYAKQKGVYTKTKFDKVWHIEAYLHLFNPLLLLLALILLAISILRGSIFALALLLIGVVLLVIKPYRSWIKTQFYLLAAMLRSLKSKENIWIR